MNRWENGMLASSLAGHDKGKVYVIVAVESEYVYLADGKGREISRPKKKKKIHVQLIRKIQIHGQIDDEKIRLVLESNDNPSDIGGV